MGTSQRDAAFGETHLEETTATTQEPVEGGEASGREGKGKIDIHRIVLQRLRGSVPPTTGGNQDKKCVKDKVVLREEEPMVKQRRDQGT